MTDKEVQNKSDDLEKLEAILEQLPQDHHCDRLRLRFRRLHRLLFTTNDPVEELGNQRVEFINFYEGHLSAEEKEHAKHTLNDLDDLVLDWENEAYKQRGAKRGKSRKRELPDISTREDVREALRDHKKLHPKVRYPELQ